MLRIILALCLFAFPALASPFDPSPLAGTANLAAPTQPTAAPYYTCPTDPNQNWYVDATLGNDGNPGHGAGSAAFKTIGRATWMNNALLPGQCISVGPGTYNEYVWLNTPASTGGAPGQPIVLRSLAGPAVTKIVGPTAYGESPVEMQASYVVLDGFDVSGGQVSNGINCIDAAYNWTANHAHHVTIVNNIAHGCGGEGIAAVGGDWYTIIGNVAYGNAGTSGYQTSGISIASAFLVAPGTGDTSPYHNVVLRNLSYNNIETFTCASLGMGAGCHSDGEGIIIDCFDCQSFVPYTAKTLVAQNVTYGNGGNGIQIGRSSNVTVANNLACNNMLDLQNGGTARSEIGNFRGSNNIYVNNIAVSYRGSGILANNVALLDEGAGSQDGITYPSTNTKWDNNLGWDASGAGPFVSIHTPGVIQATMSVDPKLGTASPCPNSTNPTSSAPVVVQVPVPAQTVSVTAPPEGVLPPPLSVQIVNGTPGFVSLPVPVVMAPAQTIPYVVPAYTVLYTVSPGNPGNPPTYQTGLPEGFLGANPNIGAN